MNKLISVIVTIYNREKLLNECLDSLKAQTYKDFEVIMVDDGSTDNSITIAQKYADEDNRFKLIKSEHIGFPAAKNLGLSKVQGDYIIFLDSDDSAYSQWLEFLYHAIELTGADISTCYYDEYDEKKAEEPTQDFYDKNPFFITEYAFFKMHLIYHKFCSSYLWNKLVKKEIYDTITFNKDQLAMSDISEIYKIMDKANKVAQVQMPLVHYRRHAESMGAESVRKGIEYFILRANILAESVKFVWDKYPQSRFIAKVVLMQELQRINQAIGNLNFKKFIDRPFFKEIALSQPPKYLFK